MVRFGIIGAGNIASRFADSLSHLDEAKLIAISARNKEKGQLFSEKYSVPYVYEDPTDLLDNKEVDAVYIALPHGMHREWSVKAMKAGKSVLCEKPAGISADEVREIAAVAKETGNLFMEAMKPRFIPVYEKLRTAVREGAIGEIERIEASLCRNFYFTDETKSYHIDPVMGGCLLDMGIYGASYLCDFLPGEPEVSETTFRIKNGVDFYASGELEFPGGKTGFLECAFDEDKPEHILIIGKEGKITIEHPSRPQVIVIETDNGRETVEVPYNVDDFFGEISHFADCINNKKTESSIMPLSESIRCAELIDMIKRGLTSR